MQKKENLVFLINLTIDDYQRDLQPYFFSTEIR